MIRRSQKRRARILVRFGKLGQFAAGPATFLLGFLILVIQGACTKSLAAAAGTLDAVYTFSAADFFVDPFQPFVYATSGSSLQVINSTTLAVAASIPLPATSYGMTMSPDGNKLYIAGGSSNSIFVLDTHTRNLLPSLSLADGAYDLAMGLSNRLFVLGSSVFQIDATTGASTGPNAPVYVYSGALRISPDRKTLYYANFGLSPGTLYKLDVSSTTPSLIWQNGNDIGENGEQLALSRDGSMVAYVCGYGYGGYQIPNFRTSDMSLLGVLPTGAYPNCMAYSPDNKYAYALHALYPTAVDIYDLSTYVRLGQFNVDDSSRVITTDQTGQHLFVAFNGTFNGHNEVRVYDTGVTIATNQPPVARCHDVTRSANSSCQASVSAADVDNGSQGDAITLALSPAGPYPLGTNHVTLTVTDTNGASDSCTALVIVQNTKPPTLTCPNDVVVAANDGCSAINVNLGLPATSDTCGVVGVTNNAPVRFPLGTNLVTWTATDGSGNSATCIQRVIVRDTTPPTLTCPNDVTVAANDGCSAINVDLGVPAVSNNCGTVNLTNNAPARFPLGTNLVTWTATDGSGNSATCVQRVIVWDTAPPTLSCPNDVVVAANDGCSAVNVNLGVPAVSNNCGVVNLTNNAPVRFPLGTNLVTWTATDASGNSATCVQRVIVRATAPQILSLTATPNELWPPNHLMVPVTVTVEATGSCDPSPQARIVAVTCNQPANPSGPDWELTGPLTVNLRAKRVANSGDRIYTLFVEVTDSSGNKTDGTVTVTVPHNVAKAKLRLGNNRSGKH